MVVQLHVRFTYYIGVFIRLLLQWIILPFCHNIDELMLSHMSIACSINLDFVVNSKRIFTTGYFNLTSYLSY